MNIGYTSICEKIMLIDTTENWKPDDSFLMHILSYCDHGAHKDYIEEAHKAILDEAGKPKEIKLSFRIDVQDLEHEFYERDDELLHCKRCGGAEGSLPTECPGEKMTEEQEQQVYDGDTDYRNGIWV